MRAELVNPTPLTWLLKASRPGFWPTHLWFYLLPFGRREMFGSWEFFLGCVYVCFPLGLLAYGFNDLFDAETDRKNPRKDSWIFGACLNDEQLKRLPWWIAASQVPFLALFVIAGGPKMLLWFAALVGSNALYNAPPFSFKNRPVLDLLNQTGYLLVFVLGAWLCSVPQLSWPAMTFSALFAMHCHLFGQLMDIDADLAAGRRTTASVIGIRGGKLLAAALMLTEAAIAFVWFQGPIVAAFSALGAAIFIGDATVGFKGGRYPSAYSKGFFLGWNAVVLGSMYSVWKTGLFVLGG
ncbi:MAG: UbiA family prenyltransferase [Myxococcaceae bacterium]